MRRVWYLVAIMALMAVVGGIVGCSSDAESVPAQGQNPQGAAGQPPVQGQGGPQGTSNAGQPGQNAGQTGGPAGAGVSGTVKSVSGNTIQLTAQDGSAVTVKTDDKTGFQKTVAGTSADIQTGVRLAVTGDQSSGTITAKTIQIMPAGDASGMPPGQGAGTGPGGGQGTPGARQGGQAGPQGTPGAGQPGQGGGQPGGAGFPSMGTVKSVSGNTIQLTAQDSSTITVQVNDQTTIAKTSMAALSDIQAGVLIAVMGDNNGGTVTARMIQIGSK